MRENKGDRESLRDYSHLNVWLPKVIDQTGLSIEQFSWKCGVSKQILYFYIQDKYRPSEQVMARICRAAGVPLEEGLKQYTPRRSGRPKGGERAPAPLRARAR